jgi:beta-lactamase regulating signal transducer with metallopeptidase domain
MALAMTASVNLHVLAEASAGRMLNCVAEGILVALFAWIVVRFVGRQNSGTRFAVWFVSLLAIAVLPAMGLLNLGSLTSVATRIGNTHSAITLPSSWALDLFIVWAVIAGIGLIKIGIGLWRLRQLRRSCALVDVASLDSLLQKTLDSFGQQIGQKRQVRLLKSDRLSVPAAIGFFRPAVVIPTWSLEELSPAELNVVLLHELAHLQRWDDWTNLAQKLLRAVFFFHPAVWFVESKLSLEREMACDDVVLAATSSPRAYAECLVSLAEKSFVHRGLALAQAAVSRMRQTTLRVSQILDGNRPGTTGVWKPAVGLLAAFSVVTVVAVSQAPELVAFKDKVPEISASVMHQSSIRPVAANSVLRPINASFVVPAQSKIRMGETKHHVQKVTTPVRHTVLAQKSIQRQEVSSVKPTLAKFGQNSANPRIVQTNGSSARTNIVPTEAVFVVMQGQTVGESGSAYWTICVWRVTVFNSRSGNIGNNAGIPAKSI